MPTCFVNSLSLSLSIYLFSKNNSEWCQVVEGEADPLLNAENGKGGLTDAVVPKAPVWNSNKDLHAWSIVHTLKRSRSQIHNQSKGESHLNENRGENSATVRAMAISVA